MSPKGIPITPGVFIGSDRYYKRGPMKGQEKQWSGIEMRTVIQYRTDPAVIMAKRNMNKMMRATNKALVLFWQKKIRPQHFKPSAVTEYGYQRRMSSTFKYKMKKYGHNNPLMYKGALRAMTMVAKSVTATPTSGRLVMMVPWYLKAQVPKAKGGLSPDLYDELTRVSKRDGMWLARHGSALMKQEIIAAKRNGVGKKTVKVT